MIQENWFIASDIQVFNEYHKSTTSYLDNKWNVSAIPSLCYRKSGGKEAFLSISFKQSITGKGQSLEALYNGGGSVIICISDSSIEAVTAVWLTLKDKSSESK